jgi:hypothetical protein
MRVMAPAAKRINETKLSRHFVQLVGEIVPTGPPGFCASAVRPECLPSPPSLRDGHVANGYLSSMGLARGYITPPLQGDMCSLCLCGSCHRARGYLTPHGLPTILFLASASGG